MGQVPEQRSAVAVLGGLLLLVIGLAIFPVAIPALDAVGRFVAVPAVGIVVAAAVFGPGVYVLIRGRGRQPPET